MKRPNQWTSLANLFFIAVVVSIAAGSNAVAQQQSDARFPALEGPVEPGAVPPLMFDALGNPTDATSEVLAEQPFNPAPGRLNLNGLDRDRLAPNRLPPRRLEPNRLDPSNRALAFPPANVDPREPTITQRARPLPGCDRAQARGRYSQADYERALYQLALLEHLLRERAQYEAAMEYNLRRAQGAADWRGYRGRRNAAFGGW